MILKNVVKRVAGAAGKTVKAIDVYLDEAGHHVNIDFTNGKSLDIGVKATHQLTTEWGDIDE